MGITTKKPKNAATSPKNRLKSYSTSYMHWHGPHRKKHITMPIRQSELKQYCIFCGEELEIKRMGKFSCGSKQCRRDYAVLYKRMQYTSWRELLRLKSNHIKFK